jgi:tetratricopeptide (TPR) repeat protein
MIDCPVDGRKNITSPVCPQCKTDLSPLIYIRELPENLFLEGTRYLTDNKVDDAIKKFISALEIEPGNTKFLLTLGNAYLAKGMTEEALNCSSSVITLEPGNEEAALLEKNCNAIKNDQLRAKQKESARSKIIMLLLIFVPVITLLCGLFIPPVLKSKPQKIMDPQKVVQQAKADLVKNDNLKGLQVTADYSGKTFVLSGVVPTGLHKALAEEILLKNLQKDELTKNERITNSITIKPDQLFISYIVRSNDNLTKISKFFLGDPQKWPIIVQYNSDKIIQPGKLKVGTPLRIPIPEYE